MLIKSLFFIENTARCGPQRRYPGIIGLSEQYVSDSLSLDSGFDVDNVGSVALS